MSPLHSNEKTEDDFFNGEWLRKATVPEVELGEEVLKGHFVVWYQLNLSSKEALREDQVRTAAEHLYRKVPSFGFCYAMRDGVMWLKRATNPKVDFKALQGVSLEDVRESIRNSSFKSKTGPLFCIRFLQDPPNPKDSEDLEPTLPHKSHVIFGIHHGTGDGTSNMHIMGIFASILNDVVSGNPVKNEEICGTFVTDEETQRLLIQKKMVLEADPKLQQRISEDIEYRKTHPPYLVKCFPKPNERGRTATIVEVLDRETTSQFIQRCKKEKITVNSAVTAVMNMAVVDALVESGVIQESYVIQNFHIINMRRYWESKPKIPLGCHLGYPLTVYTETPRDVENCFWKYAASLGQELKEKLESGRIIFDKAFTLLPSSSDKHSGAHSHNGDRYEGDFVTSNMGDTTAMVTMGGEKVRITNVVRGTTFQKLEYPVLLNCHTFRGRLTFTYEYITSVIQAQAAQRIVFHFVKRILEIAKQNQ